MLNHLMIAAWRRHCEEIQTESWGRSTSQQPSRSRGDSDTTSRKRPGIETGQTQARRADH